MKPRNLTTLPVRLTVYSIAVWMIIVIASAIGMANETGGNSSTPGKFLGAKETTHPGWFKESFLDFEEDIDEAAAEDKRLILYFHQSGCPYCNKLVEENFTDPVIADKVRKNFDLVAINMWGDREVVQVGGKAFSEKTLAAALRVNFTPTLLFFSEDRQVALRLDGYYPSAEFIHALDYVSLRKEKELGYADYIASLKQGKETGALNSAPWLSNAGNDLSSVDDSKLLAVLFEEPDCETCDLLHRKTFTDKAAPPLLANFEVFQFNRWADTELIKPDGTATTPKAWATELNLGFAPAIVLFNEARDQVIVIDAMFKTFHILGAFDYVASGAYRSEPSFQRYLSARAEHIRSTGQDVDIWKY